MTPFFSECADKKIHRCIASKVKTKTAFLTTSCIGVGEYVYRKT